MLPAATTIQSIADCFLLLPALSPAGKPVSAAKRKKWCDVPKNLDGLMLDTEHVYTFHIWQHFIDFSAYKFSVGGLCNLDLAGPLNGQPLQLTVYDTKVRRCLCQAVWPMSLLQATNLDHEHSAVLQNRRSMQQDDASCILCLFVGSWPLVYLQALTVECCAHHIAISSSRNDSCCCFAAASSQAKEHLFSMLVWHERLLYDPARQANLAAAQAVADKLTKLGTGLKWLLGSSK
jgi:hypothetical protein